MNININALTSNSAVAGAAGSDPSDFRTRMQQSMAPVAQLFGTTPDQLMDAVRASGGSLADYAASKGISSTDLTAAIKQGLQANAPNGVQLSDTQLTNIANRIENHKPSEHAHRGHHKHGGQTAAVGGIDALAAGATDPTDPTNATNATSTTAATPADATQTALLDLLSTFNQQI